MNCLIMICRRWKKKNAIIVLILLSLIVITYLGYNVYPGVKKVPNTRAKFFEKLDEEDYHDETTSERDVGALLQERFVVKRKIQIMKKTIRDLNLNQRVSNNHLFNGLKSENFVLVVQVHHNLKFLATLLDSLRHLIGVKRSLLVFSHDYFDNGINDFLRNITFAKVLQIFYPYSTQLNPYMYPGKDPNFCLKVTECHRQKKRKHILAQQKLFWWWTLNEVFGQLEILNNYNGYIYFMENEQYIVRDFIYMAKMVEKLQPVFCPDCVIIGAGASRSPRQDLYRLQDARLLVHTWGWSKLSNSGIGFNRTVWNTIKDLKEHFCYFNDYNWDHSLRYLASKTDKRQFFMLSSEGPRILPLDMCGVYDSKTACTLEMNYIAVKKFLWKIKKGLFPHNFDVQRDDMAGTNLRKNVSKPAGEWADARDHEFCMFMASRGRREYY